VEQKKIATFGQIVLGRDIKLESCQTKLC